ncbi:possible gluconolactonase precursor [Pseudooceanicola batsensis HTCC2597]|uniref:Possible gluconolactonase n=1 Tax=Pseudooceanicola batsensis (strain ATCC BAA-863 / DSM 15984 / KCTC 12145 / HTCC2597) TaxID=252305 RepID=A3U1C9_PSEBH|nr:SMP-30/gluconolactonase/LRE family protein [Pseudooceanicola batsensis]EAQ02112.1 possible gluconolactonase precursor [Pseudooceanicola batsensis HTCC2597]
MSEVEYEIVTTGLGFPEGPVVMPDGSVIVVEIATGDITRVAPDGSKTRVAHPGGGPNGAALGPDGALYVCNNGGFRWREDAQGALHPAGQAEDYDGGRIERIDLETGEVTVLYTASDKAPLKGPNDIVFDADGGFWCTDHGKVRERDQDRGAVLYGRIDGSGLTEVLFPMYGPNGVGRSPDGKTLWVAETFSCRLWAFDVIAPGQLKTDPRPGALHGGRLVASPEGLRGFDSLAVDAEGNVCIGQIYTGAILIVSPEGRIVDDIAMPDPFATNIAFGGDDMKDAYVTLSSTGQLLRYRSERPGLQNAF